MAERCRTWNHGENCGLLNSGGTRGFLCSCGHGKVGEAFSKVTAWKDFASHVTRVAINSLFLVPFLERTRQHIGRSGTERSKSKETESKRPKACAARGKCQRTKKCGGCGTVYYCSKACQTTHWKRHKSECGKNKRASA